MSELYQKTKIISSLNSYFLPYIKLFTKLTGYKFFLFILAVMSLQKIMSIQHTYKWFLAPLRKITLNTYYNLLASQNFNSKEFVGITIGKALNAIDDKLKKYPIYLIIDDTLQAKYGEKFDCYDKLFDHAQHNGSSYLYGHCFVALTMLVPVIVDGIIGYRNIPICFRLKNKDENKLTIASDMIKNSMTFLENIESVILLCDSWYPKGDVLKTVSSYENLNIIASVRVDTALYDLPVRTGKRGRPSKRGKKLNVTKDFDYVEFNGYYCATRIVKTNLFKDPVHVTVTNKNLDNSKGYRLFISTILPQELLKLFCYNSIIPMQNKSLNDSFNVDTIKCDFLPFLPYMFYLLRWNIEVMFYELKTFWSFGNYMVRSKQGIENFVNILSLSYTCTKLLPFHDSSFASLASQSPQVIKFALGETIRKELFFSHLTNFIKTHNISSEHLQNFDVSDIFNASA